MKKKKIKIGMRVTATDENGPVKIGDSGEVLILRGYGAGVEFDRELGQHSLDSCRGALARPCKRLHGWFMRADQIEPAE